MAHATGVTRAFCDFIVASRNARLPQSVEHATIRAFSNWLGCALGAAEDATVRAVLNVAKDLGGNPQASVVGRCERLDVVNAALVNGVAANALEDGTHHEYAADCTSGSPQRPLTDAQLQDKFMELARRVVSDEQACALYAVCASLGSLADVSELRRFWVATQEGR